MTPIIAGRFDQEAQADTAVKALRRQGFEVDDVSTFFLNPAGQHATFPIGGDEDVSPGATDAHTGAMKGAAVGGAVGLGIGLAASPLLGAIGPLAGAGAGAYAGSLVGALGEMKDPVDETATPPPDAADDAAPAQAPSTSARHSGVIVAARAPEYAKRIIAVNVLRSTGAQDIERAEGTWHDGKWADFDPLKVPLLIDPPATATHVSHSR